MNRLRDSGDDAIIGRAFRVSLIVIAVVGVIVLGVIWFAGKDPVVVAGDPQVVDLPTARDVPGVRLPTLPFADITQAAGIDFVHESGAIGEKLLPETMGGGCAFFDYDNDGDQDLFLVNSQCWPWDEGAPAALATSRLYANDGRGNFSDVSASAGVKFSVYGMGVAVGDYDNDGWVDLFITAVGFNKLLRNLGGRFVDVSEQMAVMGDADEWSTSCGWFDYDNDGDLDLFVCNYVRWSRDIDLGQDFKITGIGRAYGAPTAFEGTFPYLYRNDGDRFTDVSSDSGLLQANATTGVPLAKSLGVAPFDFDRDGWMDLIVANDTVRNLLFHNQRDGTFQEVGIQAGVAFDSQGKARGAMGIDAAHFRNDDCVGVAIGNFANEMTALYVCSDTPLLFTDDAIPTGLGPPTRLDLTFGTCFVDLDLDGRLDLIAANGHLEEEINTVQSSQHYRQPSRVFWNAGADGTAEFVALSHENLGGQLGQPIVGRGAAYAGIDADGDLDVLFTQIEGAPLLLRNDQDLKHNRLRFKLIGRSCNRDAIGARVEVSVRDRIYTRYVMPTRGYLSQSELPVTVGLGAETQAQDLPIYWPDGSRQAVESPTLNEVMVIEQALDATR